MQDTPFDTSSAPKKILCVMAHPDDVEFCVGGSLARWTAGGAEVSYLILTDGCNGSADRSVSLHRTAEIRQQEQLDAAKILGVKNVVFCEYQDCHLSTSSGVKRDIVRAIRKIRPDTVITIDPTMAYSVRRGSINHADHRAAGQATLDAVFPLARDYFSFPELTDKEKLEPHQVTTMLLINYDTSNFWVDITGTMDIKVKSIAAHASQFPDMPKVEKTVRRYAKDAAHGQTYAYAEAFIRLDIPEY